MFFLNPAPGRTSVLHTGVVGLDTATFMAQGCPRWWSPSWQRLRVTVISREAAAPVERGAAGAPEMGKARNRKRAITAHRFGIRFANDPCSPQR
jgi:hypothetical protein